MASSENLTDNTDHHWFKSLMLIQLCLSVMPLHETVISYTLLNLEMSEVKWYMKQSSI